MFFRAGVTNNGFYFQEINAWAENTGKDLFFFSFSQNHISKDYNMQIWLHSEVIWTEV